ncbi:Multidrug efflux pump subunit AcrB [Candidatus Kryptobacter tengchongensis]|nr:Multidrug efflux pump subunit AcrB [Candidatus Kryptobacter tengchongensis]
MIEKILKRPVTVLMFYFTLLVLMFFSFTQIAIEITPEVDFPRLYVVTNWYGVSAELVERFITTKIEEVAVTVNGVKKVSSRTREGNSWVEIEFQKNVDIDFARLELSEKLASIYRTFPEGAGYPQIQKYVPSEFEELQGFMSLSIYGDAEITTIQKIVDEIIKPSLLGIKGVANVRVFGGVKREILINVDEEKLKNFKVSVSELIKMLDEYQIYSLAGYVDDGNVRHFIYTGNYFNDVDEIRNIKIANKQGIYVKLSDFANVSDTISEPINYLRINGMPSLSLEIDKEPGINMIKVANLVDEKINELEDLISSRYGLKIGIEKVYDRSKDIKIEIRELASKAFISAGFIILILVLFLRNIISSFIVFLAVIFSISGAIVFLYATGIGLNIITLSALALSFGIVIDNSTVIFENIQRYFEERREFGVEIILTAVNEMRLPVIAASVTTVGALIPVFLLPENLKPYFIQFAITAGFVIIFSLLVSLTFVPIASLKVLNRVKPKNKTWILKFLSDIYTKILRWNLHHKWLVLSLIILLFGLPVWMLPEKIEIKEGKDSFKIFGRKISLVKIAGLYNKIFSSEFYSSVRPYIDHILGGTSHLFFKYVYKGELWRWGAETYIVVSIMAPQGTEISRVDEFVRKIEKQLEKNLNYIEKFTSWISSRYATIRVDFNDKIAMTSIPYIIKENLVSLCAQTSGFTTSVYGFGPGFYSGGELAPSFSIQILGYNYDVVKQIAQNIGEILSQNPRVSDIELDRVPWMSKEYEIVASIDREKLGKYGINLGELIYFIAGKLRMSLGNFDVKIQNQKVGLKINISKSGSMDTGIDVRDLLESDFVIRDRSIKLGDVLKVEFVPTMPEIRRENQQYTRYVTFNFKGPYHYGNKFTDAVIKSVKIPPGYEVKRPEYLFSFGEREKIPLILIAIVSVCLVFMITASLYESFKKPFVIILSVPMSLIGLFAVFYLFDVNFGRGGYAGLILLIGLSVNNGIILVDKMANSISKSGVKVKDLVYDDILISASFSRVRPILITNFTTIAGFIPFVFTKNIYSLWYPFAIAVSGGLLFSMLITLFVIPVFYKIIVK